VVQALNLMAVLNPRISHTWRSTARCSRTKSSARKMMAVPTVFLNGEPFGQGRMSVEQILAKLDTGAGEREAEKIARRRPSTCCRRRRPRRRGGGDLRRAQGHPHRRRGRALRRPGAGHDGHRELHLGPHTEGPKLAAALERT
jgi:alkyl hydroperoxide reductase subunit F